MAVARERQGRPTQFHGVPLEERATDSNGNRLPWALEWADDSNGRYQKRQPEEKGSFGKSTKRKGSSRTTRTQTPAKRDNPALDGFEAALKFDAKTEAQKTLTAGQQSTVDNSHSSKTSANNIPSQVTLYGFPPELQWAALDFYERVSGGMICEDYEREPPAEKRRYHSGLGYQSAMPRRQLTREERALAMKYSGGACWIKVTFDAAEAADRAIASSPHIISGYWVYAQPFQGQPVEGDQPILVKEEDRSHRVLGGPKPPQRAATLGPSTRGVQRQESNTKENVNLPKNFKPFETDLDISEDHESHTSTATSAILVGPDDSALRHRPTSDSHTFRHFPDTPRTVLRPAAEALLPQLSWSERLVQRLRQGGWIPSDLIGNEVPHLDDGAFDWVSASFYWRLCFLVDYYFNTDLCGRNEN